MAMFAEHNGYICRVMQRCQIAIASMASSYRRPASTLGQLLQTIPLGTLLQTIPLGTPTDHTARHAPAGHTAGHAKTIPWARKMLRNCGHRQHVLINSRRLPTRCVILQMLLHKPHLSRTAGFARCTRLLAKHLTADRLGVYPSHPAQFVRALKPCQTRDHRQTLSTATNLRPCY